MTDSYSGLHDPYEDQLAAARYRAERDMLAQAMERVADDIEWTFLGFEGAEDAPAMRWAREFRAALGSLHAPGFQKSRKIATSLTSHSDASDVTMSAHDLLPEAERDAIAWVRGHGGLDSVKKLLDWVVDHCSTRQQLDFDFWLSGRVMHELGFDEDMADRDEVERRLLARLMPEGMEWLVEAWPRFEDGEPVSIGDEYECWCCGTHRANSVTIREGSSTINATNAHSFVVSDGPATAHGKRVMRPAPKIYDADGAEIRVGDTLYYVDGREQRINTVARFTDSGHVQFGTVNEAGYVKYCEAKCIPPNQLTHRDPVLAADGRPLRDGETVWHVKTGREYVVVEPSYGKTVVVRLAKYDDAEGEQYATDQLTHERPENKCRDCKHGDAFCDSSSYAGMIDCKHFAQWDYDNDDFGIWPVEPDGFCAWGKERDGE